MSVQSTYTSLLDSRSKKSQTLKNQMSGIFQPLFFSILLLISILNYFSLSNIYRKIEPNVLRKPLQNVYPSGKMQELRRAALLTAEQERNSILEASKGSDHKEFYKKVKMESYCDQKERIGEHTDGGKYVCNPGKVKKDCTLVSLGLNDQIGYDQHIFEVTGKQCKIIGADKGTQKQETINSYNQMNGGQLFVGKIPDELTILKMMETSGRKEVELLKIDIEGGEHTGLEPLLKDYYVCQIFIEVHGTPAEHLSMLQTMGKYGFRLFNIDPNPVCMECCEYSLINELCMAQYEVVPLAITIPFKNN
uniref:Methyltransf_21 domain-containing protein n=2 Tax=Caenorhabditis tropicalis TaxID=1561998 RepID=A0A1I7TW10_9PELO